MPGDNFPLPKSYIYISHLNNIEFPVPGSNEGSTDFRYWILPFYPDTISDTMTSTFTPNTALGRSAPVYTFSNAGPREVRIEIELHRDLMDETNFGNGSVTLQVGEDYVDAMIRALQAAAVPKYNLTNKAVEPPLVALRIVDQIFIRGVLTSGIGITYSKPILNNDKYAGVTLSMTIAETDPYDAIEVFQNGSFRGEVKTMRDEAFNIIMNTWGK